MPSVADVRRGPGVIGLANARAWIFSTIDCRVSSDNTTNTTMLPVSDQATPCVSGLDWTSNSRASGRSQETWNSPCSMKSALKTPELRQGWEKQRISP